MNVREQDQYSDISLGGLSLTPHFWYFQGSIQFFCPLAQISNDFWKILVLFFKTKVLSMLSEFLDLQFSFRPMSNRICLDVQVAKWLNLIFNSRYQRFFENFIKVAKMQVA